MKNENHNTSLKPEQIDHFAPTCEEQLNLHVARISGLQLMLNHAILKQKTGEKINVKAITHYVDSQMESLEGELLVLQTKMDLERQAIEDLKRKSAWIKWGLRIRRIILKITGAFTKKKQT